MNNFLDVYHEIALYALIGFAVLGVILYFYHIIKVASIKDYKAKYDYIRNKEINTLRNVFYMFAISVFALVNLYAQETEWHPVWFFVRLFMSFAIGVMFGYIANLVLQYYYPSKLDKKLKKWRYIPRINSKTGNKMRLLSEDEEDVHLDEGMQAEEEAFSVDYDVWIDEETGDTKIEKYQGHLQALQCNNCGFYTMKVTREEIVTQPTATEEGELIKHYECNYCGSIRATSFNIAKTSDEEYQHVDPHAVKFDDSKIVSSVKIEIIATDGHKKNFAFQNVEQATAFLEEFDYSKVSD